MSNNGLSEQRSTQIYPFCEAMMDLGIVSRDIPAADNSPTLPTRASDDFLLAVLHVKEQNCSRALNASCGALNAKGLCSCPVLTVVPSFPRKFTFKWNGYLKNIHI